MLCKRPNTCNLENAVISDLKHVFYLINVGLGMQLKFTCMQPLVLDEISFGVVGLIAAFVGTHEGFLWRNSVQTIFRLRKTVGHKVCVQLCCGEKPLLSGASDQLVGGNGHDVMLAEDVS